MSDDHQPADTATDTDAGHAPRWSMVREDIAVVFWCSFMVASLFTMGFFAFVDPEQFAELLAHPWWLPNAMTTYALGFFGFWSVAAMSGGLTAYMIDTSHGHRAVCSQPASKAGQR